ncbi:T9SS type A sorting domain-containing protein [bacterium]|nr:T9SS type A sorting domain-containing protein [bacterium]
MIRIKFPCIVIILICFFVANTSAQDIPISTATANQVIPQIASAGTTFFAIWEDHRVGEANINLYGQQIYSDGSTFGAGYAVCTLPRNQTIPAIAANENTYIIVWANQVSGSTDSLFGRLFFTEIDSLGGISELLGIAGNFEDIAIASDGANFLVVVQIRGASEQLYCRKILADGEPMGAATLISIAAGDHTDPAIAWNGSEYLVVWRLESDTTEIKGQFIDTEGRLSGSVFTIVSGSPNITAPSVAWNGTHFLVVWQDYDPVTWSDIHGQKLDIDGSLVGSSFIISDHENSQMDPEVINTESAYITLWVDGRSGFYPDIFGQCVSPLGSLSGDEYAVTEETYGQQNVKVAWNGTVCCAVWDDFRNGFDSDIYAKIIPGCGTNSPNAWIVQPLPYTYSSCQYGSIVMIIQDPDGIDDGSIQLEVNGVVYMVADPELSYSGDTLIYDPGTPWVNGETVDVCLLAAEDMLGNPLDDAICWTFYIDLAYPAFWGELPPNGSTIEDLSPTISINIADSLSGLSTPLVQLLIESYMCGITHPCAFWDGVNLAIDLHCLGLTYAPGDTVDVCAYAADSAIYCFPNDTVFCWEFYIFNPGWTTGIIHPAPNTYSACPDDYISMYLSSDVGIDPSSIQFWVGRRGSAYTYRITDSELTFDNDTLTFIPSFPFVEAETVWASLIYAEDSFGTELEEPVSWEFVMDFSAPGVSNPIPTPGSVIYTTSSDICIDVYDSLSGLDVASLGNISVYIGTSLVEDFTYILDGSSLCIYNVPAFSNGDTVTVCLDSIYDTPDYCIPNETSYCWSFFVSLEGPVAGIVHPMDHSITACDPDSIVIYLEGTDATIDESTIELYVNWVLYTIESPELYYDTLTNLLVFIPPSGSWSDGDFIEVELTRADDIYGTSLLEPLAFDFIVDYISPIAFNLIPEDGEIVSSTTPTICVSIVDSISGLNESTFLLTVAGVGYDLTSPYVTWDGSRICFDTDAAGISWAGGDTVEVCLYAEDSPDYCEPNVRNFCWYFVITPGGPVATILRPFSGAYSSCGDEMIEMAISDGDGIDTATIQLGVNAIVYSIDDYELTFDPVEGTLICFPGIPFTEGVIDVALISADDWLGNPLEGAPLSWSFYMDYTPPRLTWAYPAACDSADTSLEEIMMVIVDDIGMLDTSSIQITFDGITYPWGLEPVYFRGDTLILLVPSTGTELIPGESYHLCIYTTDLIDYCYPNILDSCWYFHTRTTGIAENENLPENYILGSNYPNPFNSSTRIPFQFSEGILEDKNISLTIFDIKGREVDDLTDELKEQLQIRAKPGKVGSSGTLSCEITWTPENLNSGIYLTKLNINDNISINKVIFIK